MNKILILGFGVAEIFIDLLDHNKKAVSINL